ncbi:MAG: hypothetical protein AAF492_13360, partial [Verrucomicrobiota bacterium]
WTARLFWMACEPKIGLPSERPGQIVLKHDNQMMPLLGTAHHVVFGRKAVYFNVHNNVIKQGRPALYRFGFDNPVIELSSEKPKRITYQEPHFLFFFEGRDGQPSTIEVVREDGQASGKRFAMEEDARLSIKDRWLIKSDHDRETMKVFDLESGKETLTYELEEGWTLADFVFPVSGRLMALARKRDWPGSRLLLFDPATGTRIAAQDLARPDSSKLGFRWGNRDANGRASHLTVRGNLIVSYDQFGVYAFTHSTTRSPDEPPLTN